MGELNKLPKKDVDVLWEQFDKAMRAASDIFGNYAFRKVEREGGSRRLPINKALFEAVSANIASLTDDEIATLTRRHRRVQKEFLELMSNVDFQAAISQGTGDPAKVRFRFDAIRHLFAAVSAA